MQVKLTDPFHQLLSVSVILLLILSGVSGVATGGAQEPPEKPAGLDPHNSKIEASLQLLSSTASSEGITAAMQHASETGIPVASSNSVKVVIEKEEGGLITPAEIRRFGGEILGETDDLVEIRIPPGRIEPLVDEIDGIKYLRTPHDPVAFSEVEYGSYFSKGVNLTGGGLFHSKDLLGRGTKIAVIDLGFGSLNYAKEDGDLPEEVIAGERDYAGGGLSEGDAHGTAVAEIVHDMAPLAELYLKRIDTEVSLREASEDAISQGVDVIVHSVGWVNTNFGDGTGVIAETAKDVIEEGVLWVNAAGNSARRHWEGGAQDGDGDGWVEFSDGSESISINVDYASTIQLFLTWNDWPESDRDFDLFLYDGNGKELTSSQNYQTGEEPPAESVSFSTSGSGSYKLKVSAPKEGTDISDTRLEIFSFNHPLDPYVESSSVMAPGNVEKVLTVGSINRDKWKSGDIAPYSSRGPTADGRIKPDLTAVDGVETLVYGGFLGTSAAAPHAAGAAALILEREPDLGLEEISQALKNNTKELGQESPNDTYGWGKMRLLYKNPKASRTIGSGQKNIEPGDELEIKVEAEMPLTLQGGLEIEEEIPAPLQLVEINRPGSATKSDQEIKANWPIVEAGGEAELSYKVQVPEGASPGEYEFSGTVNGETVQGSSTATVLDRDEENFGGDDELVLEGVRAEKNSSGDLEIQAEGENISEIRVKVYSTTGKEIFDSSWQSGQTYQWGMYSDGGKTISNGIYLYVAQVRGQNDEIERSELKKYLVLR